MNLRGPRHRPDRAPRCIRGPAGTRLRRLEKIGPSLTNRSRSPARRARNATGQGSALEQFALWKIVAQGRPDGAVSRIEVVTLNQIPGGY